MKILRQIVQWIMALMVAFIGINIVSFPLHRNTGWIEITGGPTLAISEPNEIIIQSSEGYGVKKMDAWGYANPSINLSQNGYVLSMGSSITKANHVQYANMYTYQLNHLLGGKDDELKVYNIGQDGATFDSIAKCFPAAIGEFPNAKAITIEFCILGVDDQKVKNGFEQYEWIPGAFKNVQLTASQKLKFAIKKYVPFVSFFMENRANNISLSFEGAFGVSKKIEDSLEEVKMDADAYEKYYRDAFSAMRNQYEGELIISYIPALTLENDGMKVKYNEKIDLLLRIAPEYDIQVINGEDIFLREYKKDYTFPLGFANTSYGAGHLNAEGQSILAEELYYRLKDLNI